MVSCLVVLALPPSTLMSSNLIPITAPSSILAANGIWKVCPTRLASFPWVRIEAVATTSVPSIADTSRVDNGVEASEPKKLKTISVPGTTVSPSISSETISGTELSVISSFLQPEMTATAAATAIRYVVIFFIVFLIFWILCKSFIYVNLSLRHRHKPAEWLDIGYHRIAVLVLGSAHHRLHPVVAHKVKPSLPLHV